MAKSALNELNLDEVIFIPCGCPPHKESASVWNSELRLKLADLLVKNEEKLSVSDIEIKREGKSYTAQTLKQLSEENPDTQYFFIVGADSLCYMDEWMTPQVIFENAFVAAIERDGYTIDEIDDYIRFLEKKYGARICKVSMPKVNISSSMIRKKLALGEDISPYTGEEIYREIRNNAIQSYL